MEPQIKKVVLAYSGGLDTSVILRWLQNTYACEVVTFTADLGQGEELEPARKKAELFGIKQIFVEDLRETFVKDFVFPMFRANALYEGQYLLGTSIARPLIAQRQIEIAEMVGAKFVQEVHAVSLAVEKLHPEVYSVIELGGQDAKIIIFKKSERGEKTAIASMNDKCASGTGATIDKCMLKVCLPPEEVVKIHFDDTKLHHVAAKCGVFAETDIVNLVKSGIPRNEIMNSLADAIVSRRQLALPLIKHTA